jgi:two-component system, sensor histidine kinase and response regulator
LLDVARIRAGGMLLNMKSGDVLQLCQTITNELQSEAQSGRIQVTATGDTRATFDADRMSQVFSNLLGNALQHGEPQAPVSVDINGTDDDVVAVSIGNRGTITADCLQSLFEPFQARRGSQAGLGLGLYISSQFVQAHGGSVEVTTELPDETVFKFAIPRRPARDADKIRLEL